jgi:hypothetical protein
MNSIATARATLSALVTDSKLKDALTNLEDGTSYSGLLGTIDRYRRIVADVGDVYEWETWKHLERKYFPNGVLAVHAILRALAHDLRGSRFLAVFDCDQLLEQINIGLATRSFRQATLGARAVLERAAVTQGHIVPVQDLFKGMDVFPARRFAKGIFSKQDYLDHLRPRVKAASALRRYTAAATFNWSIF